MKLAIIGAGIAGLTCAHEARHAGHDITLFDKGRGPGGRLSTRRMDHQGRSYRFDHGAVSFQPRSADFSAVCEKWLKAGWIAPWQPRTARLSLSELTPISEETHYTGHPSMNALVKGLADGLDVRFETRIHSLKQQDNGWILTFEDDTPDFHCDGVVCATPAEQAAILLENAAPDLSQTATRAVSVPVWAVMLAFEQTLSFPFDLVLSSEAPFERTIRNTSKPGRDLAECWVLHGSVPWTTDRLDWSKDAVVQEALSAFSALTDASATPIIAEAHRWLYAQNSHPAGVPATWDADSRIGTCGDWHIGADIEAAWMSGRVLGERLKTVR